LGRNGIYQIQSISVIINQYEFDSRMSSF
jgi:hypothetical protein